MRLPAEQVSLIFKALEQMAGKGTVSMEELRGQLGDALPGAFEIAAKAMGKSTAEFSKMVANGEVLAADFLPKFGDAVRRELGGSVDEASQGAQAAFNRLGNAFFELRAQMAESGFLDAVTTSVKELTDALNDPATIEGLRGFASLIGDVVTVAAKAAAAIGSLYTEAQKRRDQYLAVAGKAREDGEWYLGVADTNKRVDQADFTQRMIAEYTAQKTKAANAANEVAKALSSDNYTLGTAAAPAQGDASRKAQERAAKQAAQLREQLANQVQSMAYGFADPEEKAALDAEKQQELLREALEAKAITEQEFRELSLESEIEYQERLKEIRDKAREEELTALDAFLGIRLKSQQELNEASLQDQAQSFRQTISEAAKHNRAFFMLEKASALARATIAAYESVVHAYNFGTRVGGPPVGAAFAAVAAAAQAVNIASIASSSFGSGGGVTAAGGAVSAGTTGNAVIDSSPSSQVSTKTLNLTLHGYGYSKNDVRELINAINDAAADGSQLKIVGVNA